MAAPLQRQGNLYQIYAFDPVKHFSNLVAVITELPNSLPRVAESESGLPSVQGINQAYAIFIANQELKATSFTPDFQNIKYPLTNLLSSDLITAVPIGCIPKRKCTVYLFLQFGDKTGKIRLIALGSNKVKHPSDMFGDDHTLLGITKELILSTFTAFKTTDLYKQAISDHAKSNVIHLFGTGETIPI
jgi:hypothetical protein